MSNTPQKSDPYDVDVILGKMQAFSAQGRPDKVLAQLQIRKHFLLARPGLQLLFEAITIAAEKGSHHLTKACFAGMMEFTAGVLFRLQLATELRMDDWNQCLAESKHAIPLDVVEHYLPAIDHLQNHIMNLAKVHASYVHVHRLNEAAASKKRKVAKKRKRNEKVDVIGAREPESRPATPTSREESGGENAID